MKPKNRVTVLSEWTQNASDTVTDGYTVTYVDADRESLLKVMDTIHEHNKTYPDGYFNV